MKEIFARIDRAWAKLIWLLMGAAAAYIGLMLLSILYITIFRTAGWNYSPISFVLIEYGFVYMLFLGSPWLIRNRGHVYIEMLTAALSAPSRVYLSRLITLCCATICFIWAWYSGQLVYEEYTNDVYDELRTQFDIYRWIITIAFPLGFLLMGIEFIRFLFLKEPMHQGIAGIASEHAEIEEQKALAAGRR
ncbi:MAG: TRAP transporter small permease [Pseudomonadota bacterium]|nr:TRAP transporter small permease [Pseudomonadota bacterium]